MICKWAYATEINQSFTQLIQKQYIMTVAAVIKLNLNVVFTKLLLLW